MGVEARTLTKSNADELAVWCDGIPVMEHDALDHGNASPGINVPCGSGNEPKRASVGDTIVRMHDGTFEVFQSNANYQNNL